MTHIVAISGAYISGARARAPAAARRVVWCGVVRPFPAPPTNPHPLARCRRRAWPKSATPRLPPGCGACARVGAPAQLPGEREGEGGWVWGGGAPRRGVELWEGGDGRALLLASVCRSCISGGYLCGGVRRLGAAARA